MAMRNDIRVSDAERDSAAAELREHFIQGRLTLDELEERLDAAFAAKRWRDLDGVMTDLPRIPAARREAAAPAWPGPVARYAAVAILAIMLVGWLLAAAWFTHHGYPYAPPGGYLGPH